MDSTRLAGSSGPTESPSVAEDPWAAPVTIPRGVFGLPSFVAEEPVLLSPGTPAEPPSAPAKPHELDPTYHVHPSLTLVSLGLCLAGFIEVAVQLYVFKFVGFGPSLFGLPSRVLFVSGLTLAVAPLVLAIFRRPVVLFVLPPIALIFLLYPLLAPYGVAYGQDPIYDFQFARSLLESGHWLVSAGVTNQGSSYVYYPGSAVFNAELSAFTGVPLQQTFLWGIPLLRLLMFPATIYALGKRYFGPRIGFGGVLIFLGTPSILFNTPVQSEFAIPFFALSLVLLGYIVVDVRYRRNSLLVAIALFSGFVVISHTLTAYTAAVWLGSLVLFWALSRRYTTPQIRRVGAVCGIYLLFLFVFTYWVALPQFLSNYVVLQTLLSSLRSPSGLSASSATSVGSSFPEYLLVWSYLAYLALILGSLLALRGWIRTSLRRFATPNLTIAILAVVVTMPLLVTSFNWVSERNMEFGEIFMAPAIACLAVQWLGFGPGSGSPVRVPAARKPSRARAARRRYATAAMVLALVVLVFAGGSIVPYSSSDQLAPPSGLTTGSSLHITQYDYSLANWARSHLTASSWVWGDYLTYSLFGGFGQFHMQYDQYAMFNGTTIPLFVWGLVTFGTYVVVDKYMTTTTPLFQGDLEPTAPLTLAELGKFNNPEYFDLVFQDSTFTIYQVIAIP